MSAFDKAVAFVLREEDGLSEDPEDPGGVTKFGISSKAYPSLDVRALTEADATGIYRRDLWERFDLDRFPIWLSPAMLDTAVNPGPGFMPRALQRSLNALRPHSAPLAVDGLLGPETLRAVAAVPRQDLLLELLAQRAEHYALLDGLDKRYGLGWYRRLLRLHALCLELLP